MQKSGNDRNSRQPCSPQKSGERMRALHLEHRATTTALALGLAWFLCSPLPALHAQTLATGVDHTCTLTAAGGTVCWGSNQYGQIGDGTTILRTTPTNVNLPFGVTALTGNWGHTCAVTPSGGAKCWGWNDYGQLGDGTKTQRLLPTDVSGLTSGVSKIAAGYGHTCAIVTGGALKCWGADFSPSSNAGQLGNGSNSGALAPGNVTGLTSGVLAVATGRNFTCAVTGTGGVKCWGANDFDQLGNNDPMFLDQNLPVDVFNLSSGVATIAAGETHACALTAGGGVKCWGRGDTGSLGDGVVYSGMNLTHNQPGDVSGLTSGVTQITAGSGHTCAMKTNGDVLCWGLNNQGQVGDGTATNRLVPVQVASGAIAVSAGYFHTCILTTPGVSQCWGNNAQGNMGNGTQGGVSYSPTPTTYPSASSTVVVSGSNPSVFGDSVTFTVSVTGGVNGVGVRFEADGVTIPGCTSVALSSGSAACVTSGLQGGNRSIRAIYLGNTTSLASQSAVLTQTVNKADQTITFDPLPTKNDNDPDFGVTASASSGLAVSFSSLTPSICTVTGSTVDIIATGNNTCTIAANQSGNSNYNAAAQVSQSFSILGTLPPLTLVSVKSRKTHGAAGTFEIAINPATLITGTIDVESRSIGTGHRIVFTFNNPVTATGTVAVTDSANMPIGSASLSSSGSEVVVLVTGIPDNRRAKFTLTNVNTSGLTFSASVGFLIGDVNNSRAVNITDINGVKLRSGQGATSLNYKFDLNASGTINITDINAVKLRSGTAL
jgi:alpha-tubulin suppressor-like RCC1 family protein